MNKANYKMDIVFVCNKYIPAHVYTIESYSRIFTEHGSKTYLLSDYLFDKEKMSIRGVSQKSLKEIAAIEHPGLLFFFVSPNINNLKAIKAIRKKCKTAKLVYLYHEPMTKSVRKEIFLDRGYSLKTLEYVIGLSLYNGRRLVKEFDYVLLPSDNAKLTYEQDRKFNKKPHSVMHLLFVRNFNLSNVERRYFSYIGTLANNHGFREFIHFIFSGYVPTNLSILIATSSKIDQELTRKLLDKFGSRIEIHQGKFMTDKEIADYYCRTKILWLGYKHSAQSGVLPMSFMYGTPVVFSNISSFREFVKDGINAECIDINDELSIRNAIVKIDNSFESYHKNAILTYDSFFNPDFRKQEILDLFAGILLE